MTCRISFTQGELIELIRALDLIAQEDATADVNMDADACRDKASARTKLDRALASLRRAAIVLARSR